MSLIKQLITAMLAVLLGLTCGTLLIIASSGSAMLTKQLESHANASATHLALYLAPFLSRDDQSAVTVTIEALFDTGFYQRITLLDKEGNTWLEKRLSADPPSSVPTWFIRRVQITPPTITRALNQNGVLLGTLQIQSRLGFAYEHFWQVLQRALTLFAILSLLSALLMTLLLHYLLRPLRRVEQQAQALAQQHYIEQPHLPHARELRSVVQTMNELVRQVRSMFAQQSHNIDELRNLAYRDALTGLPNQRATLTQLQELVDYEHNTGPTTLLLIRVRDLGAINHKLGTDSADHLLQTCAAALAPLASAHPPGLLGRLNGAEFLLLVEQQPLSKLKPELSTLFDRLSSQLEHDSHEAALTRLPFICGLSHSSSTTNARQMLCNARLAMQHAEQEGISIAEHGDETQDNRSHSWPQHVANALRNGQVFLQYQPLINPDGAVIQGEVLARILDEDNEPCAASTFLGVVRELGLMTSLDRAVIQRALAYLARSSEDLPLCINLGQDSVLSMDFRHWLAQQLRSCQQTGQLCFELNEILILNHCEAVTTLRQQLRNQGCRFGVDNFGLHPQGFSYLYSLQPDFLKIAGALVRDIDRNDEDRFFVQSLITVAHNLHIQAYAEHIEREAQHQQLLQLGIDGCQGYLHGKPQQLS